MTIRFEWDESKRRENLAKHSIDFRDVPQVFDGPALTYPDDRYPYDEQRCITIGLLRDTVVLIAHSEIDETIRIIHVRKADRKTATRFFERFRD